MTPVQTLEALTDQVRTALDSPGDTRATLIQALGEQHPADIASLLRQLDPDEVLEVFGWLDDHQAADVLAELDPN